MKIAVLGTGWVGSAVAGGLARAGHEVRFGTRTPGSKQLDLPDGSHDDVAAWADLVVNATPGSGALELFRSLDPAGLAGKVLLDICVAETPDGLIMYPNSSVGERLQEALPDVSVVKSLSTMEASVMVDPGKLGPSTVFVSGDDAEAKGVVTGLLHDLGWSDEAVLDLGGIETARGPEHYGFLFHSLRGCLGDYDFNLHVARPARRG